MFGRVRERGWEQEAGDSPLPLVPSWFGKLVQAWGPQGLEAPQQPEARQGGTVSPGQPPSAPQ